MLVWILEYVCFKILNLISSNDNFGWLSLYKLFLTLDWTPLQVDVVIEPIRLVDLLIEDQILKKSMRKKIQDLTWSLKMQLLVYHKNRQLYLLELLSEY